MKGKCSKIKLVLKSISLESISKLCSQLVLNRLPSAEPEVFSGDPLQYNDWINSFEALISSRSLPDSEGIFYLKKYLSGEAKACVQGLLSLSTSQAFHNALKVLKETKKGLEMTS